MYDEFDHVGYDIDGQKIMRGTKKDELDHLIARFDDPNASRTIHDALHGVDVVLSDDDLKLIRRLQKRRYAHDGVEAYPAPVEFEWKDALHPMSSATPAKAPFLPSKWEAKKVMRLVMAMRSEQYQKAVANRKAQDEKAQLRVPHLGRAAARRRGAAAAAAPKLALPGNAESYNPPSEYLFTDEERRRGEDGSFGPAARLRPATLRLAPQRAAVRAADQGAVRALPRPLPLPARGARLDIDPDSLIPQMPKPAELRPFPERLSIAYKSHEARAPLSVSPSGQHLLSSAADGTVRLWEVSSGRASRCSPLEGRWRRWRGAPTPTPTSPPPSSPTSCSSTRRRRPGPRRARARGARGRGGGGGGGGGRRGGGWDADADADSAADDDDDDDDDDNGRETQKKAGR